MPYRHWFTSWPYPTIQGHRTEWRPDVFKGLACVFECHGNAPLADSCTTDGDRPSGPLSAQCAPHAALCIALIYYQVDLVIVHLITKCFIIFFDVDVLDPILIFNAHYHITSTEKSPEKQWKESLRYSSLVWRKTTHNYLHTKWYEIIV